MARSKITDPKDDLIEDSGSVLWSFVKGEQLEFPITLSFVKDVTAGYTYEAVVVEGENVAGSTEPPTNIRVGGAQTKLNVRLPVNRGTWQAIQAYNRGEVVLYDGVCYSLKAGAGRINATPPSADPAWELVSMSRIYLQFEKSLASDWAVAPTVGFPTYGFFELRVTEPGDGVFQRTWKPVRGMVQILFSPTEIVPD